MLHWVIMYKVTAGHWTTDQYSIMVLCSAGTLSLAKDQYWKSN